MKRDLVKDREKLREYDEKGSMAALGFAHGAIEHYFDRTEFAEAEAERLAKENAYLAHAEDDNHYKALAQQERAETAEKRVTELEETLQEALCEIRQSCGGCGDYREDKCMSYRDCWVKDAIRAIHIALAHRGA
jgi:Spy/CpxP family protein refolding chaperone